MHRSHFFKACSLAFALAVMSPWPIAANAAADIAAMPKADARSVWLVEFEEPPLATFRGEDPHAMPKLRGLEPTSPAATGARRLDVNTPASKAYRAALGDLRTQRLEQASKRFGRTLDPLFVYDVVNNGVALELTAAEARQLSMQDGVASVEPDFVHVPMTDAGPGWIRANALWNASGGGFRGEGRVVGVIDTGINPKHPSFADFSEGYVFKNPRPGYLGLCASSGTAGCNAKLIGIWDFTTGDGDAEANDGNDHNGHGSHVASTAAGNPLRLTGGTSLSGVAPRANIISYKACEVESTCKGTWTLAAINQAVADKVDVINYSLGGGRNDPWRLSSTAAMLNAFEAGVVVVVAAGNDGPLPGSVSSPSNAPWVLSVANTSHNRGNVAHLTLMDGPSPRPGGGLLLGASATTTRYGPAPIVYAGNYGSALCATGPNVDALPPNTSTSPWTGKPFNNEIVVCDRGLYARVIKGLNVKNAGAGGMVLVNEKSDGASLVADAHELPATHVSYVDGKALKDWMSTGSGHRASISASKIEYLPAFADILASSSGRGPVDGDWLKPNISAPGTNIQAAYKEEDGKNNLIATMSGTSMASPHVAGAVALLRQANPEWGPAEVMSALQTTARASVRKPDGATPGDAFDGGSGVVVLSKAVDPGLVFPITAANFRAANPNSIGKPRTLNLPSLVDQNCLLSCSFTRSVRNVGSRATWQASVEMEGGELSVTPASFTLSRGETQVLEFKFVAAPDASHGQWQQGHVVLKKNSGNDPETSIPVAIKPSAGQLPDVINLPSAGASVESESGWAEVLMGGLIPMPSARFSGTDLVEPMIAEVNLAQDANRDEVYEGLSAADEGKRFFRIKAGRSGTMRLRVEARSATASDIDLFVGRANRANDLPGKNTEFCRSTTPGADERCDLMLDVDAGDMFWVLVQNWQSSATGKDDVSVQAGLIPVEPSAKEPSQRPLIATGPGLTDLRESFKVRLAWNDPTMAPGETRWGHLLLGANDDNPTGVGHVLVKIKRAKNGTAAAVALRPGATRSMRLLPDQAQDRLYIEVPPNATRLRAKRQGGDKVQLFLAHDATPTAPAIGPAPARSAAAATSSQNGNSVEVSVSGAALKPGRWYVTPVNKGNQPANFDLVVSMEYGTSAVQPGWGNWYYPARDGSGFFLSPVFDGEVWVLTWYTFAEDGSPVWYLGTSAAPTAKQGSLSIDMHRHSWDGQQTHEVAVGNATLTLQSENRLQVSWNIDGESGSEPLDRIGAGVCRNLGSTGQKPDGNWYTPARSGFGVEALTAPGTEAYISYIYDAQGFARWVLAYRNANPTVGNKDVMDAYLQKGSCPLCSYGVPAEARVGTFSRRYSSATKGHMGISVNFPTPLRGAWNTDEAVELLTSPVTCP